MSTGTRSRQGCDECRRRRRKCDEQKPCCGQCSSFNRTCKYTLRVVSVWQVPNQQYQQQQQQPVETKTTSCQGKLLLRQHQTTVTSNQPTAPFSLRVPQQLPNGIPLSSRYRQLLHHFTQDILASLSCHPLVHQDLRQGLLPATFQSPQLMSACLALSAAGFLSRGVMTVDGVAVSKILGHLQSSGLGLLRTALAEKNMSGASGASGGGGGHQAVNDTLLATCLLWCLTDVFTYNLNRSEGGDDNGDKTPSSSSWRIHLQGIQALLDNHNESHHQMISAAKHRVHGNNNSMQMAMKHLYQLYLSLQTLPYIPQGLVLGSGTLSDETKTTGSVTSVEPPLHLQSIPSTSPAIDGFLGYSDELLYVLHQIKRLAKPRATCSLSSSNHDSTKTGTPESDMLLGKVKAMIARDSKATPPVTLSPLTCTSSQTKAQLELQEYSLCHRIFQQATLIQLYRQLYYRPSSSIEIQTAFAQIVLLFSQMESTVTGNSKSSSAAEPCHTWVAMAMPVFTLGCEAITADQRNFVMAKVDRLEECIRSSHVRIIRQALRDVWDLRIKMGDEEGDLCAGELLEKLDYNIILF